MHEPIDLPGVRIGSWLRSRSGQSLVEFAMVLPLLLLLVMGVFEFGRAWNAYQVITDASREAARVAVVASTPAADSAGVVDVALQALQRAALSTAQATITATVTPNGWDNAGRGDLATITVEYDHSFIIIGRLLGWAMGQETVTLKSTTVMRKE